MFDEYEKHVIVREETVAGLRGWRWLGFDSGCWEGPHKEVEPLRDMLVRWSTSRRTVVQAGGALGMYPRVLADHFERVITFEPDPRSFHVLVNNCQLDRILKVNAALGHERGMLRLRRTQDANVGMNVIGDDGFPVLQVRLDDLGLTDVDALALDVEGYEGAALAGAMETIARCRPVIALETVTGNVREALGALGYVDRGRGGVDTVFSPG